jgi:hypothetical protein
MRAQEVHILPTKTTPEIFLSPKGIISIKGRAIDESRAKAPDQFINWIDEYLANPANSTEVNIALEFLNSFNTIILTSALKKIALVSQKGKKLTIRWYYEEDDVDLYERGEYISSVIDFPFEFTIVRRISEC